MATIGINAGYSGTVLAKKASNVPTDITEDVICAVDTVWSGLKLMIRTSARAG